MAFRPRNFAALILAAGYSSRMGQFKPRLPLGNRSAIEHAIETFLAAGIRDLMVVTGHRASELTQVLKDQPVQCVFNPAYASGMFSSIVAGLNALSTDTAACFILPADVPLVRPATLEALATAYERNNSSILYPVFHAKRGHPPLIAWNLFPAILAHDGSGGLKMVLSQYEREAEEVHVLDEGIHLDMDTPAEYARLNALAACRDVLSRAECEELLLQLKVSEKVVHHSRVVAEVAQKLAAALIQRGAHLNPALIQAGSLLHDIAKGQPHHASAGAGVVERIGFPEVAKVIARHMDIDFKGNRLDESAIVYLADKLVQGETIVSLDQRFRPSLERFRLDTRALAAANRRWETARNILKAVEKQCGTKLSQIVEGTQNVAEAAVTVIDPIPAVLAATESVCPECLRRIEANRIREDGAVYLEKTCPQHGHFKTILWRGKPSYESWGAGSNRPSQRALSASESKKGCPFDCGLCVDHRQQTCCVLLEVTQRCNMACPFCFAAAPQATPDPSLKEIEAWYRTLLAAGGPFNIQLSGGEPTLRDDLPEIIKMAHSTGFPFVQLNTNGLRLAEDVSYLQRLKDAGLDCVFLQFDGVTDDVYKRIRGQELLHTKLRVIEHCRKQCVGVVLVPTLVPGVNTEQIGDILRLAIREMPVVRAVHFQPVSYFGRYPTEPTESDRITLPEVLREIERQTAGEIRASDFYPPSAENAYCSFQGKFTLQANGRLKASAKQQEGCCAPAAPAETNLIQLGKSSAVSENGSKRARQFVARQWAYPISEMPLAADADSLDTFLHNHQQNTLSISGMAFQDAWNLDLERLRDCFIHVVSPDRRLVPLCAYNLTDREGRALYRNQDGPSSALEVVHA